jgi:hypothetical protein
MRARICQCITLQVWSGELAEGLRGVCGQAESLGVGSCDAT